MKAGFNNDYSPVQDIWSHNVNPKSTYQIGKYFLWIRVLLWISLGGGTVALLADTTGVTVIKNLNSDKLGERYKDHMFAGSIVTVSCNSVEELEDTDLGFEETLYWTDK